MSEAEIATEETAVLIGDAPEEVVLEGVDLLLTFDKDQLEDYARENFGRELDKRKKLDTLRAEVIALYNGDTQRAEKMQAEADAVAARRANATPKLVRHKKNGSIWQWNPNFKGNAMLEVIAWEGDEE